MQRMSVADLRAQLQLLQHQLKASRVPFSPDSLVQRADTIMWPLSAPTCKAESMPMQVQSLISCVLCSPAPALTQPAPSASARTAARAARRGAPAAAAAAASAQRAQQAQQARPSCTAPRPAAAAMRQRRRMAPGSTGRRLQASSLLTRMMAGAAWATLGAMWVPPSSMCCLEPSWQWCADKDVRW